MSERFVEDLRIPGDTAAIAVSVAADAETAWNQKLKKSHILQFKHFRHKTKLGWRWRWMFKYWITRDKTYCLAGLSNVNQPSSIAGSHYLAHSSICNNSGSLLSRTLSQAWKGGVKLMLVRCCLNGNLTPFALWKFMSKLEPHRPALNWVKYLLLCNETTRTKLENRTVANLILAAAKRWQTSVWVLK